MLLPFLHALSIYPQMAHHNYLDRIIENIFHYVTTRPQGINSIVSLNLKKSVSLKEDFLLIDVINKYCDFKLAPRKLWVKCADSHHTLARFWHGFSVWIKFIVGILSSVVCNTLSLCLAVLHAVTWYSKYQMRKDKDTCSFLFTLHNLVKDKLHPRLFFKSLDMKSNYCNMKNNMKTF